MDCCMKSMILGGKHRKIVENELEPQYGKQDMGYSCGQSMNPVGENANSQNMESRLRFIYEKQNVSMRFSVEGGVV